jgi:hypothetical protein
MFRAPKTDVMSISKKPEDEEGRKTKARPATRHAEVGVVSEWCEERIKVVAKIVCCQYEDVR